MCVHVCARCGGHNPMHAERCSVGTAGTSQLTLDGKIGHRHVHGAAVCKVDLACPLCHGLDAVELHHRHHGRLAPAMQLPGVAGPFQLVGRHWRVVAHLHTPQMQQNKLRHASSRGGV